MKMFKCQQSEYAIAAVIINGVVEELRIISELEKSLTTVGYKDMLDAIEFFTGKDVVLGKVISTDTISKPSN